MKSNQSIQTAQDDLIRKNRRIKVFLSSTFRDLQEERDYLAKNVFMELEAEALRRNAILNLLDLRWGITEEESKHGLVTQICLKEIEESRPFFIGIIGGRYGWEPKESEISGIDFINDEFGWLKKDIQDGLSITEIEVQYGVLRSSFPCKAFFYLKEGVSENQDNDAKAAEKLKAFKESLLSQKKYPVKYFKDAEELGKLIRKDIGEQLDYYFPRYEETDLIKEASYIQECILRTKTEHYVPLKGAYDYINDFMLSPQRLLAITGESGTGKSSLIANWIRQGAEKYNLFYHFVDTACNCDDYGFILLRLYCYLCGQLHIEPDLKSMSFDETLLSGAVNRLLETSSQDYLLVIDGLNQLTSIRDAYQLNWFPMMSSRIKILCSTDDENADILMALHNRSGIMYQLPLFSDFHSFRVLINGYLKPSGKKLEDEQITKIQNNAVFSNALALFSLLEELRLYGDHDTLKEAVTSYTQALSSVDFLKKVFNRIECDLSFFENGGYNTGKVLFLLAIANDGLSEETISTILGIPRVYVSAILYKCYRFISVLGVTSRISHAKIKMAILQVYANTVREEVYSAYEHYLKEALRNLRPGRFYLKHALQLADLYFQLGKAQELSKLITSPCLFHDFYFYYLNSLRRYYLYSVNQGFSIMPLMSSLKSKDKLESEEYQLLQEVRHLCISVHQYEELSRVLKFCEEFYIDCPNYADDRLLFLRDYLTYCIFSADFSRGNEIADRILNEADSSSPIRAFAYCYRGDVLRGSDIDASIINYEKAISIYKSVDDYEAIIVARINAGAGLAKSGRYDEALREYEDALYMIHEHIKESPVLIVQEYTCLNNMAALCGRIQINEDAERYNNEANHCYLLLKSSGLVSLLSPSSNVSQQQDLGYNLMSRSKIEEGLSELSGALLMLEHYRTNMPQKDYLTLRFENYFKRAKGLALNHKFSDAESVLRPIEGEIVEAYRKWPKDIAEHYLMYLRLMASLSNALHDYNKEDEYLVRAIQEYTDIEAGGGNGFKSYYAEILRKRARCLINLGRMDEGVLGLKAACREYGSIIFQNRAFFGPYVDTMIELFYVERSGKNGERLSEAFIEHMSEAFIEHMSEPASKKVMATGQDLMSLLIFCIKLIMIKRNRKRLTEAEYCFIILYQLLDREHPTRIFTDCIFPYLADCLDKLAEEKRERQMLKDCILYSRMAIDYMEGVNKTHADVLKYSSIIQRCANYHDEVNMKNEAFGYYKRALEELEGIDENHQVIFRKAGILHDYGVAMQTVDLSKAKTIIEESITLYKRVYDEYSSVAVEYAHVEEVLANILDDMKSFDESRDHYRSSIHVLRRFRSDKLAERKLGVTLNNYGIMLLKQHEFSEAREVLLESREIRKVSDPYGVINTDDSLFRLEYGTGNDGEALKYLREILGIIEQYGFAEAGNLKKYVEYTDLYAVVSLDNQDFNAAKQVYKKLFRELQEMKNDIRAGGLLEQIEKRVEALFGTVDFLE